jgi:hypothetical protein
MSQRWRPARKWAPRIQYLAAGRRRDETTAKKAASDAAADVRSLVDARHRNVTLAEQAVIESRRSRILKP